MASRSTTALFLASLVLSCANQPSYGLDDCAPLEGLPICQLMEIDPDIAAPAPARLTDPTALKGKIHNQPGARGKIPDVTPVMSWIEPSARLKGVIVCVHGLGLHKGTYAPFGEVMAKEGYAVYAMDVRGFGTFLELPGERKCDFRRCLDDVCHALEMVRQSHPGLPVFLLGESMGGAIALRVTANHPELVDGLISSVPASRRYGQAKSSLKVGLKLITAPDKEMNVADIVVDRSTAKEDLRRQWLNDPLARFKLTPKELLQFQHFMQANEDSAKSINKTPVLMVQGTSDRLVRHDANENIIKHIPSPDSQLVFVHSAEHLIFEEGQFDQSVIKLLSNWLDEHVNAASPVANSKQ